MLVGCRLISPQAKILAWVQVASSVAGLSSVYCWASATEYESVTLIKGFALQLHSKLRCGLCSTVCYDVEQVDDPVICEVTISVQLIAYILYIQ